MKASALGIGTDTALLEQHLASFDHRLATAFEPALHDLQQSPVDLVLVDAGSLDVDIHAALPLLGSRARARGKCVDSRVLQRPSRRVQARCVEEVIVFDARAAVQKHAQ